MLRSKGVYNICRDKSNNQEIHLSRLLNICQYCTKSITETARLCCKKRLKLPTIIYLKSILFKFSLILIFVYKILSECKLQ